MQHCVACSTALSAVFCMQRRSIFTHTNKTDSKYSFFNFRPELWNVSTQGQPNISYLLKTFSNHFLQILILCKVMQMSVEQNRAEANNSYQSPQRQQMKELMNSEFEPHPNCYSATEYRIQLKSDYRSCEPSFSTSNHYLHVLIDSQESIKREFSICMRKIMLTKMV